jgi:hypothetical protein
LPGALALLFTAIVAAQPPPGEVEKHRLLRQHNQDELLLKQRQSQDLQQPGLTPQRRRDIEYRHAGQAQRQRQLFGEQVQRQEQLQSTLPQLPEHQQTPRAESQMHEFSRERAEQLQRFEGEAGERRR